MKYTILFLNLFYFQTLVAAEDSRDCEKEAAHPAVLTKIYNSMIKSGPGSAFGIRLAQRRDATDKEALLHLVRASALSPGIIREIDYADGGRPLLGYHVPFQALGGPPGYRLQLKYNVASDPNYKGSRRGPNRTAWLKDIFLVSPSNVHIPLIKGLNEEDLRPRNLVLNFAKYAKPKPSDLSGFIEDFMERARRKTNKSEEYNGLIAEFKRIDDSADIDEEEKLHEKYRTIALAIRNEDGNSDNISEFIPQLNIAIYPKLDGKLFMTFSKLMSSFLSNPSKKKDFVRKQEELLEIETVAQLRRFQRKLLVRNIIRYAAVRNLRNVVGSAALLGIGYWLGQSGFGSTVTEDSPIVSDERGVVHIEGQDPQDLVLMHEGRPFEFKIVRIGGESVLALRPNDQDSELWRRESVRLSSEAGNHEFVLQDFDDPSTLETSSSRSFDSSDQGGITLRWLGFSAESQGAN